MLYRTIESIRSDGLTCSLVGASDQLEGGSRSDFAWIAISAAQYDISCRIPAAMSPLMRNVPDPSTDPVSATREMSTQDRPTAGAARNSQSIARKILRWARSVFAELTLQGRSAAVTDSPGALTNHHMGTSQGHTPGATASIPDGESRTEVGSAVEAAEGELEMRSHDPAFPTLLEPPISPMSSHVYKERVRAALFHKKVEPVR